MSRTRKWLLGVGAAVGALIVLIVALGAWLLYTPSGLRFALDRGVAMMHGQLAYASASGALAGETTIDGLRFRTDDGTTVRVEHATLDLKPYALLAHRLHVARARIDGITVNLEPAKPSSKSAGFPLKPPLTMVLDDTRLTRITIDQRGKPAFVADSLALAGSWSRKELAIRTLALKAPDGGARLSGTFAIASGHRGHGKATFDWTQDGTRYAGTVTSTSDGTTAHVQAAVSAPTHLTADASVKLGASHPWTLVLKAPKFDARALPVLPASLKTLALDVRGSGNAQGGKLTGHVVANGYTFVLQPAAFRCDGKSITLDPLRLRSPQIPGSTTVTGVVHVDATPMTFALDTRWQDVTLPADLAGQALATHGNVHVEGDTGRFAVHGELAAGPPGHLSNLDIDLAGTPQTIDLHALKLVQKNGGLDAHGTITLKPRIAWKLDAVANKLDPGAILAGWSGALDFRLATAGYMSAQGPEATLKLDRVGGTLRGRSIAGTSADLAIRPGNFLQGSLTLVSGGSRIDAVGQRGPRTNATLNLHIASLGDWIPDASGSVKGRFTLKGSWPKLAVAGQLHGDQLRAGARGIRTLALTASIPDLSHPGGDLDLTLDGVQTSGLDFDTVHLTGHGNEASHQLHLSARGKQLRAVLALQGHWQARTRRWTGTLSDVALTPKGIPTWRQQQPTTITWQRGALTLSEFCLSAGAPELCLTASRDAHGAIKARYKLARLPLQLLASVMAPANPLEAGGEISGAGQITMTPGGALNGSADLNVGAGNIAYASNPGTPLLAWTRIDLDATAHGSDQHVRLRGALSDGGHINGDVSVTGSGHALAGTIDANLRSLAFLEALSPEIAGVHGTLGGNLQLAGTLATPQFTGRIQTHGFSAEIPRAGLDLRNGEFAISGEPQGRLAITGQVTSGKGVLHVKGTTGLAADAPLTLEIKGDNVLVADIPAAHVVASPDLHIARTNGVFALTGTVTIPSAKVELEKLPGEGPAQASPDVVIVDAPPTKEVAPLAMQADLQVRLGDDIKVQGYGFDGKVHGQLTVQVRPGRIATGRGQLSVNGKYQAYGQNLTIDQGRVLFAGTRLDDPGLDIRAVRKVRSGEQIQSVTAGLHITGTAQHPVLAVFSDPAMPQDQALSYLVTGRPLDQLKSGESNTLNTAAEALGGLAGNRIAKSIGARLGLETGISGSEALGGSAFTAGKYLSPRLFLSYGVGLFTPGQVVTLRYTINRFLQFEAENATTGNRASLNYQIEK